VVSSEVESDGARWQGDPASSVGKSIQSVLKSAGQDPAWFAVLGTNRNFFIHEGAPCIAVDVSEAPQDYDILIMTENP
jgi:hypothetical protein